MKVLLAALCLSAIALAQSGTSATAVNDTGTSVADAAKQAREKKTATAKKVYTDDNIPKSGSGVSVVGEKPKPDPYTNYSNQPADPVQDQKATDNQWHAQIETQKARIAELEQQLQVAEANEARSTHYWEVNPNPRYAQYKQQVESLKQQIEDAKNQLADLQDKAHKAGANKAYD